MDKISYSPDCTIDEACRVEIARAMDQYFNEKNVDTALLTYYFSDSMREDRAADWLNNKGFCVEFGDKWSNGEPASHAHREYLAFANDNPLEGFKTYIADNENHTAITWEDLVDGINKRFEMLGSQARINSELFRKR